MHLFENVFNKLLRFDKMTLIRIFIHYFFVNGQRIIHQHLNFNNISKFSHWKRLHISIEACNVISKKWVRATECYTWVCEKNNMHYFRMTKIVVKYQV